MEDEFDEQTEREISNLFFPKSVELCEELIDWVTRAGTGINRFALKTYLLKALRHGYKEGLKANSNPEL